MSQWARANPEDERLQSLTGQREVLAERADYARQGQKDNPPCKRCDGEGSIDRELMGDLAVSVEACPDCRGTGVGAGQPPVGSVGQASVDPSPDYDRSDRDMRRMEREDQDDIREQLQR